MNNTKIIKVNSLGGLKNQLYSMEQDIDTSKEYFDRENNFFDINSLFWSNILSEKHVKELIHLGQQRLQQDLSYKIKAVFQEPEKFLETYQFALKVLKHPVKEQLLFQSLETLEIICNIHSKVCSLPFILTLANGYIHNQSSSRDLLNTCLLPLYNPYLYFLESKVLPTILEFNPDIVLLTGKPNIASFAIAKFLREQKDKIFIIAAEYESDYYSLRKIKNLLQINEAFFSVYHCVLMENNNSSVDRIEEIVSKRNNLSLKNVPGIIYSIDSGKTIIQTQSDCNSLSKTSNNFNQNVQVLNTKAFPLSYCYWNKCTFCGINSKYDIKQTNNWDINSLIERIDLWYSVGIKNIWFIDESIPVNILNNFAKKILQNNIKINWHFRSRIEQEYTKKSFSELLYKAGVRHILFGLESASERILKLANKTNNIPDYIENAEKIVDNLTKHGIFVHFSTIIGFPTETEKEIEETTNFLKYLFDKYTGFSYNINTFYLDVGSQMYKRWETFGISSLSYPCPPKYFLDNNLDWNSRFAPDKDLSTQKLKEDIMKHQYPWYPQGSLIKPSVFFAFWEYSRYCLLKSFNKQEGLNKENIFPQDKIVVLSYWIVFMQIEQDTWLLYHLKNHNYVIAGKILQEIVIANNNKQSFSTIVNKYKQPYRESVIFFIQELQKKDFFV